MTAAKLSWTRDHKSTDGRFWCYKAPRASEWRLFDRHDKDEHGNSKCYLYSRLSDCKRYAEVIAGRA